ALRGWRALAWPGQSIPVFRLPAAPKFCKGVPTAVGAFRGCCGVLIFEALIRTHSARDLGLAMHAVNSSLLLCYYFLIILNIILHCECRLLIALLFPAQASSMPSVR